MGKIKLKRVTSPKREARINRDILLNLFKAMFTVRSSKRSKKKLTSNNKSM